MTQLLEKAYAVVPLLSETDQDAIAALILDELEDERHWQTSFALSQGALARLAQEALAEHRADRTQSLNPETF